MQALAPRLSATDSASQPVGRGLQLLLLALAISAAVYAKAALGPLQESMRAALALSDNQMALLQGPALVFSMALVAVPLGLIIDRYSRVRLLFGLVVLLLVGSVWTALSSSYASLFAARAVVGLGALSIQPVILSLIADLYPADQRGRASMITLVGQYAGWSAVFGIGGELIYRFGADGEGWRWAILWLTVPLLVPVILAMFALREPTRNERLVTNPSAKESFIELWRYRPLVVTLLLGIFLKLIALHSILMWAAPVLARGFSLSPDKVGAIIALVMPIGGIAGSLVGGSLADLCQRTGGPRMTLASVSAIVLIGAPLCVFPIVPSLSLACVLLALAIALFTAVAHMATALAIVVIPNELRGLYFGMVAITGTLGLGSAPLIVSMLSAPLGGGAMIGKSLMCVGIAASIGCAIVYAVGRMYVARGDLVVATTVER
jgi:MFS family permease